MIYKILFTLFLSFTAAGVYVFASNQHAAGFTSPIEPTPTASITYTVLPSLSPSPSPIATPTASPSAHPAERPLTFDELNTRYGPCAFVPTLMYHHIEDLGKAKTEGHAQLTVHTPYFKNQMQYLKDKGYTVVGMNDLVNFFDSGFKLPAKPILLTFDDGYIDFATDALPILKEFGYQATLFLPTGLAENGGYVSWSQVMDAANNHIYIANHTWSHHSVAASDAIVEREIQTADKALSDRGLNPGKIFAYPYGNSHPYAINYLTTLGYKLAFTTRPGMTECKGQRLELPRTRIGNAQLNNYGL